MRTNPKAVYRHSGRGGHADRRSFNKQIQPMTVSVAEAERVGNRAVESVRLGLAEMAGGQARRAAQVYFAIKGRE